MPAVTLTLETHLYRGPTEREYPVTCTFTADEDDVQLLTAVIEGDTYPVTSAEWDRLIAECETAAPEMLAEEYGNYLDYLADQAEDERMMEGWQ